MLEYSEPVAKLIDEFKRLHGIGQKLLCGLIGTN